MWSHYAANHHGICIEYDKKEFLTKKLVLKIHPVIYTGKLFDATLYAFGEVAKRNPLLATIAACHKFDKWSYEEEWRLISLVSRRGYKHERKLTYPPKSISLGAKILENEKELVTAIANDLQIPLFRASLASDKFKLEFTKV